MNWKGSNLHIKKVGVALSWRWSVSQQGSGKNLPILFGCISMLMLTKNWAKSIRTDLETNAQYQIEFCFHVFTEHGNRDIDILPLQYTISDASIFCSRHQLAEILPDLGRACFKRNQKNQIMVMVLYSRDQVTHHLHVFLQGLHINENAAFH